MNAPAKLTIDIWSDVMCPWCIIGYSQLQKGLAQLAGAVEAEVRWLPFELNPDMPVEGEGQSEHIARKYGRTPEQAEANRGQLHAIGERAGYSFAYAVEGEPPAAAISAGGVPRLPHDRIFRTDRHLRSDVDVPGNEETDSSRHRHCPPA